MIERELDEGELLNVLLNHLYPHGNVSLLTSFSQLCLRAHHGVGGWTYVVNTDLPDGHWAFKHTFDPRDGERQHRVAVQEWYMDLNLSCSECFGTGFTGGFQAPCSRGCRS